MVVRVLIDTLKENGLDLTSLTSEEKFKEIFLETFKKKRRHIKKSLIINIILLTR